MFSSGTVVASAFRESREVAMRAVSATMIVLLLSGAGVTANQPGAQKKHKDAKHAAAHEDGGDRRVALQIAWTTHELEIVRSHYGPKYRNLPPGLRKKYQRTGQLPPGWQKKMEPFPATLERDCAPLPAGYRRGVIDAHAVIYNTHGVIIDVAVLF
jgi:hypothetical protein